jgi:hypothetical protein
MFGAPFTILVPFILHVYANLQPYRKKKSEGRVLRNRRGDSMSHQLAVRTWA